MTYDHDDRRAMDTERTLRNQLEKSELRVVALEKALKPFADIADEFDKDGLDETRMDWIKRGVEKFDPNTDLYCGRGGKTLIVLEQVLHARDVLTEKNTS